MTGNNLDSYRSKTMRNSTILNALIPGLVFTTQASAEFTFPHVFRPNTPLADTKIGCCRFSRQLVDQTDFPVQVGLILP